MFVKSAGTYLALSEHCCMIFRAVGSFPFFKVPSAIILNDYIKGGELCTVKENSIEIQGLINNPEKFAIASLDEITDNGYFKEIDTKTTGKSALDPKLEAEFIEKIKQVDAPYSGLHINGIMYDLVSRCNFSIPQARIAISTLRKKIKDERNNSGTTDHTL